MMDWLRLVICISAGYSIGSIPFGIILGKWKGVDLRQVGSGNIGAVNAFRALGPFGGTLTLLLDIAKGGLPLFLAGFFGLDAFYKAVLATFCIVGHNWSIFLNFKGGKGVAALLGITLAIDWRIALIGLVLWIVIVAMTGYSSLGSMTGSAGVAMSAYYFNLPNPYIIFFMIMCLFVFWQHRSNLQRLSAGQELKITDKVKVRDSNS